MIERYLEPYVLKDLRRKMVFVGGARQTGKTTLAKRLAKNFRNSQYFNWDDDENRRSVLERKWTQSDELIILDEIHKYGRWKRWLKGLYDTQGDRHKFLVTGSSRLDVYRRGGDSLLGRYHYWRLHPFTLSECPQKIKLKEALERLLRVGGFPEPFLHFDEAQARRWRRERFDRILRDDVRDLENVRDISLLGFFVDALRKRVGSPVVLSNIAQELEISPKTAAHWLEILERMYVVFKVLPYTRNLPRAIKKPPKVYFFDNGDVLGDEGAVFENLIATHLLKQLHFQEDSRGYRMELRYIRDKEGREVDFAILKEGKLTHLLEAKYSDQNIDKNLVYYSERFSPSKAIQVVCQLTRPYDRGKLNVVSPIPLLAADLSFD